VPNDLDSDPGEHDLDLGVDFVETSGPRFQPLRHLVSDDDSDVSHHIESARNHIILGEYSAAEPFIRHILVRFEAKYGTRFIKGNHEVVQMLVHIYCRTKEWSTAEQILMGFQQERRLSSIDARNSSLQIIFDAAVRPMLEMWANVSVAQARQSFAPGS
jgi:hypothetical protein